MMNTTVLYRLTLLGVAAAVSCTPTKSSLKVDASTASTPGHVSLNDMSIMIPNDRPEFRAAAILSTDQADQIGPNPADAQGKRDLLPAFLLNGLDVQINGQRLTDAQGKKDYPALIALLDPTYHPHFPLFSKIIDMNQNSYAPLPSNAYSLSAVRLDPCFNIIETKGDDAKCIAQMRLLWQPIASNGAIIDQNVHEIFRLERADFIDALQTVISLRQGAELGYDALELQPQPLMVTQGPSGPYFKGLKALISRYAQQNKLMGAAGLIRTEDDKPRSWEMAVVTVQDGAIPSLVPLTTVSNNNQGQPVFEQFFQDTNFGLAGGGFPTGVEPDAFGTQLFKDATVFPPLSDAVRKTHASEALARLDRINDPHLHDIFDTDCSSCHQSTLTAKGLVSQCAPAGDPAPLCANHQQPSNAIGDAFVKNVPQVLQMFSFRTNIFDDKSPIYPVIQTRVVTETALVVDYVNTHYLKH